MRPIVSIVMSAYNEEERYLRAAVESVLTQECVSFEFIIVDDGSSDGSADVVEDYSRTDSRIRLIRQRNTGLTGALIRACGEARGDFIARQDADDRSLPGRFAKQTALLEADPDLGFVSCWARFVGPGDEPLDVVKRPGDSVIATQRLLNERDGPPAHGTVIFRRGLYELVGGYRSEFYYGQDSDLWLRMAERARIAYVPEVLYRCRREPESISGTNRSFQRRFGQLGQACRAARAAGQSEAPYLREAAELTARIRATPGVRSSKGEGGALDMAYVIGSQLARKGDARAGTYLWRVVKARPWHWKAWLRLFQSKLSRSVAGQIDSD